MLDLAAERAWLIMIIISALRKQQLRLHTFDIRSCRLVSLWGFPSSMLQETKKNPNSGKVFILRTTSYLI